MDVLRLEEQEPGLFDRRHLAGHVLALLFPEEPARVAIHRHDHVVDRERDHDAELSGRRRVDDLEPAVRPVAYLVLQLVGELGAPFLASREKVQRAECAADRHVDGVSAHASFSSSMSSEASPESDSHATRLLSMS